MYGAMASPRSSMNGPLTEPGDWRQVCERSLKACAHWADSEMSSAPCWPSGATTRDWTVAGSTATHVASSSSSGDQAELLEQVEGLPVRDRGRRCAGPPGEAALGGDLLVQRGGSGLEERALSRAETGHPTASL